MDVKWENVIFVIKCFLKVFLPEYYIKKEVKLLGNNYEKIFKFKFFSSDLNLNNFKLFK